MLIKVHSAQGGPFVNVKMTTPFHLQLGLWGPSRSSVLKPFQCQLIIILL